MIVVRADQLERSLATPHAQRVDAEPSAGRGRGHVAVSIALASIAAFQFLSWAPQYLTWPLYPDHEVFASLARDWQAGAQPYRDRLCNNFPGTIFIFSALQALGLAPQAFLAFDAALLGAFCVAAVVWSRKRFGSMLPGLISVVSALSYYSSLSYSQTAQRDWQAPLLMLLACMCADAAKKTLTLSLSALIAAFAVLIRPQAILFVPVCLGLIVWNRSCRARAMRHALAWSLCLGCCLFLGMLPLLRAGVFADFVASIAITAPGGSYNRLSLGRFAATWFGQLSEGRVIAVALGSILLGGRSAWPTATALTAASLYKPLSPYPHEYLNLPLMLTCAWSSAFAAQGILSQPGLSDRARLAGLLFVACLMGAVKPEYCRPMTSLRAIGSKFQGARSLPFEPPAGYARHPKVNLAAAYPWRDYRALVEHLAKRVERTTRVANCLKATPAILSDSGLRTGLPAESIAWLRLVKKDDEPRFAEAIARDSACLVVWSPREFESGMDPPLDLLRRAIEDNYAFEARFGTIEVWSRRSLGEEGHSP